MFNHRIAVVLAVVVMVSGLAAPSSDAITGATKANTLTLNTPVHLPGVVLLPGRYSFESGALGMNRDIVRVTSADGRQLHYLGFTNAVRRPATIDAKAVLIFDEAPVGAPKLIAAWFPVGAKLGHEFIYR